MPSWRLAAKQHFYLANRAYLTPNFPAGQATHPALVPAHRFSGRWIPTGALMHPDSYRRKLETRTPGPEWLGQPGGLYLSGWSAWVQARRAPPAPATSERKAGLHYGPALPIGRFGNSRIGTIQGPLYRLNSGLSKTFSLMSVLSCELKQVSPT